MYLPFRFIYDSASPLHKLRMQLPKDRGRKVVIELVAAKYMRTYNKKAASKHISTISTASQKGPSVQRVRREKKKCNVQLQP